MMLMYDIVTNDKLRIVVAEISLAFKLIVGVYELLFYTH
jgi:hypothetical protein